MTLNTEALILTARLFIGSVWLLTHPSTVTYKLTVDRLCGLVGRVTGYRTEMCCDPYEVRTKFIYVM
jgi:hypothetical protein